MPDVVTPNSAGQPEGSGGWQGQVGKPGAPGKDGKPGKPQTAGGGGSITLSRPESLALTVFETEGEGAWKRAAAESGLSEEQVKLLHKRSHIARRKGFTLKGPSITLPPHPDEDKPSLVGDESTSVETEIEKFFKKT
jgi:hypothetical protein